MPLLNNTKDKRNNFKLTFSFYYKIKLRKLIDNCICIFFNNFSDNPIVLKYS